MLSEIDRHFTARLSFSFETTLSGRVHIKLIEKWKSAGYRVKLLFLRLNSPEEAIARVELRVRQGGHNIAEHVIRCRYIAGLENFSKFYAPMVDSWCLYDNSGPTPVLIDWNNN